MAEEEEPKVYYEENSFIELFGTKSDSMMKVIDTLLSNPTYKYTKIELAEASNISESTIFENWDMLTKHELVERLTNGNKNPRYQLNSNNPIVEKLYKLSEEVMTFRREKGLAESKKLEENSKA